MTQVFQGNALNQLARKSRFLQRERKLAPFMLMLSIISSLGSGRVETLADLHRSYNFLARESVAYKPFHNQLSNPTFADFMRHAAEYLLETLIQKSLTTPLKGAFSEFERILLQDGSSFAVKDELASVYPQRFHTISPAAVELLVTYVLLNDKLEAVTITEDTAGGRAHLPTPLQLSGALLLADAGYFSRDYVASLIKARVRFIIKADGKINPVIESCHTPSNVRTMRERPFFADCWSPGTPSPNVINIWSPICHAHVIAPSILLMLTGCAGKSNYYSRSGSLMSI